MTRLTVANTTQFAQDNGYELVKFSKGYKVSAQCEPNVWIPVPTLARAIEVIKDGDIFDLLTATSSELPVSEELTEEDYLVDLSLTDKEIEYLDQVIKEHEEEYTEPTLDGSVSEEEEVMIEGLGNYVREYGYPNEDEPQSSVVLLDSEQWNAALYSRGYCVGFAEITKRTPRKVSKRAQRFRKALVA